MAVSTYRQATEHIMKDLVRKKNMNLILEDNEDDEIDIDELPDYPLEILRKDNKAFKILHAKNTELEWSEELIRDINGKVIKIKTTYPDMSYEIIDLITNNDKKVVEITSKDVEVE